MGAKDVEFILTWAPFISGLPVLVSDPGILLLLLEVYLVIVGLTYYAGPLVETPVDRGRL